MVEIPLTQGRVALIDDCDAHLANVKWYAHRDNATWYACRKVRDRTVLLHRSVLGVVDSTVYIDHKNGNGLDCRRENLRLATRHQNSVNRRKDTRNTSGFKGVTLHRDTGKWQAAIYMNARTRYLGLFTTAELAAMAYDAAAREAFGEFAAVNFPREGESAA